MGTLAATPARWNLLTQQTLFGELKRPDPRSPGAFVYSNDGWEGYPATRERILRRWVEAGVSNPVALGGDIHTFTAADLELDGRIVGSEFVGGSITSLGGDRATWDRLGQVNPRIAFADGEVRGYGLVEITPEACDVRFRAVESALVPRSPIRDLARFVVEDRARGLKRA